MQDLVNKMGGKTNINRFLSGELVLVEKSSLKLIVAEVRNLATWKTVTLGQHKDYEAYYKALEADGYSSVGDYAGQILNKIEVFQTPIELDLVVMTVGELGFSGSARRDAIYDRATNELGLQLCPAEVGPALRLAYKDQPYGEWLRIAMEPITVSDGHPGVFGVGNDEGARWLDSYYGRPDIVWCAGHRWVFVVPRKSSDLRPLGLA
jgi:hypothetical protein